MSRRDFIAGYMAAYKSTLKVGSLWGSANAKWGYDEAEGWWLDFTNAYGQATIQADESGSIWFGNVATFDDKNFGSLDINQKGFSTKDEAAAWVENECDSIGINYVSNMDELYKVWDRDGNPGNPESYYGGDFYVHL